MCKTWGKIQIRLHIRIWIGIKMEIQIRIGINQNHADPQHLCVSCNFVRKKVDLSFMKHLFLLTLLRH
jgi:hypothetical protein